MDRRSFVALCAAWPVSRAFAGSQAAPVPILQQRQLYSTGKEEIVIRDFFQDRRGGVFLDVGCWHPIKASNTYFLEHHLDWSGIAVDALPDMGPKWKRRRPRSRFFNYIVTDHAGAQKAFFKVTRSSDISGVDKPEKDPGGKPVEAEELMVPTITLTKLLDEAGVKAVDFVTMDIEGHEPAALAGFDIERFRPALVCIEAKPRNRTALTTYFRAHHYVKLDRYVTLDASNWYFTPAKR